MARHTVMYHSSTSVCISNLAEIGKKFCGVDKWADVRRDLTGGQTLRPALLVSVA